MCFSAFVWLAIIIRQYRFGTIVKSARENSRMTVEELAEKLSLTDRYIYKIESGEKLPSFKVLYQLVRMLSINPDSIFYRTRDRRSNPYAPKLR